MKRSDPLTLRQRLFVGAIAVVLVAAAVGLVGTSLGRPAVQTFPPTPARPAAAGDTMVGPLTYTVDASDPDRWRFFDFSRGSVVSSPAPLEWDLAFRRFHVVANGGKGFAGEGGIADLGPVPFDSVGTVPDTGYAASVAARDTLNPAIEDWYDYSFTSHLLRPKPRTYAVRTADGGHAKLEILSYYCPGARPGCLTFRYVYRGDGGHRMAAGEGADGT